MSLTPSVSRDDGGAGPVGLTMAAELARYGVSVRVIDKAAARTPTIRTLS
jgi:2-polyprenyl-6-methoxyphenol hydroxylase-like FAD-dependent oxidoreductase